MTLPEAEIIIRVPFHDVDLMEVVWHGHYAKYFEIARCALLDKIAYNYREMRESGFAWPVIEMKTRYAKPMRLDQLIKVRARMTEFEMCLKIAYLIADHATSERLTKGHTVQVAVDMKSQEMLPSSPEILFRKLGVTA